MEITYDDFKKVQIKVGTILEVKANEKARKPSLVVKVDFGKEIGKDFFEGKVTLPLITIFQKGNNEEKNFLTDDK